MPALETEGRLQKAVYWAKTGHSADGEATIAAPVELEVRWNNKQRVAINAQGTPVAVDAVVVVAQEIIVGSTMWLGELADWYGTGSAGDDSGVMEVLTYNETPDLKKRNYRRTVGLVFYKDTLPGA
jgi:hypothetical protein